MMLQHMNRRRFIIASAGVVAHIGFTSRTFAKIFEPPRRNAQFVYDAHILDYMHKIRNFDAPHSEDVFLGRHHFKLLESSLKRLKRLQRTVGHGNFYLLNFDEALKIARSYPRVGRFTRPELEFLEMIFYEDGAHYGFLGDKPLKNLTDRIRKNEAVKIPHTGNYLYKGRPFEVYRSIKKDIGDQVILTSGIRSVIKQFMLFLNKAYQHKGNLSLASRSLAPPGYSYHGIGDFDVGQVDLGPANFTERFTKTRVFGKLEHLGYIRFRYQRDNFLGVRFEPWHIKVHELA